MDRTESLAFRLHLDFTLLGAVFVTCLVGLVVLFSAADQSSEVVVKQAVRMGVGFLAMAGVAQISPRTLARWSWLAVLPFVGAQLWRIRREEAFLREKFGPEA